MYIAKIFLFAWLGCTVFFFAGGAAWARADVGPEDPNHYYVGVEVLYELPINLGVVPAINGYETIVCHSPAGVIVVALPHNPELLGLVRWLDGEIYNLYPTIQPWFEDWPLSCALDQTDAKGWLNTSDNFIWWSSDHRVISRNLYGVSRGETVSIDGSVFSILPRWQGNVATREELSRLLAVL